MNNPNSNPDLGRKNSAMQPRAQRTRDAILVAAASQFDALGFAQTTLSTILATGTTTKGAIYFHFTSKEAIALQLIDDWNHTVRETIHETTLNGPDDAAAEQLTAIFTALAQHVTYNAKRRAGMKLTLEPGLGTTAAFAHWVDAIGDIVDAAITTGEFTDTPSTHRLAWNLCAGMVGAAHAAGTLREDVDLPTRIADAFTPQLRCALAPA